METASLDDILTFNEELAALAKADVPLELGLGSNAREVVAGLARVNEAVTRRTVRGASPVEALAEHDPSLPPRYRGMLRIGVRSGDLPGALDSAARLSESVDDVRFG
jgi:type II secretory pathway component PulF